ncbi:MAG: hypothetical protein ACTSR8_02890 [Promethearchaeota archaeon]
MGSLIESATGFFTAGFVILSLILGTFIILKYFEHKKKEFIFVGFTWIGIASLYWGYALNYLFTEYLGIPFDAILILFFATGTLALIHITWMIPFTEFLYKERQKSIMKVVFIEVIVYEIIYSILFFMNPAFIGTQISCYYVNYAPFVKTYIIITISLLLITGLMFAKKCLESDIREIQLKGKWLNFAFISFSIGLFLEIAFILPDIVILISRIIVGSAAIEFYFGFVLPDWLKKLSLK